MSSYLLPTYKRQPISFVKGQGSYLYTADGTPYLDALTGIAVCGLGHCHPRITAAIADQAATLVHTSNLFGIDWQERAGEKLCQVAGMDKVFFANSGAEANEAALKMARLFASNRGQTQAKVIVMEKSFHGRTLLTVSATANRTSTRSPSVSRMTVLPCSSNSPRLASRGGVHTPSSWIKRWLPS